MGHNRETRSLIYANHQEMAKMASLDDVKFKRTTAVLVRWLKKSSASPWFIGQRSC